MIRIIVADDHNLVRQALAQMLQTEKDMQVVGQASNAEEAVALSKLLSPDVVLMDIHMPRGSEGIEATRRITAENPRIRVIMLTMERQEDYLFDAIKAGANGYMLKNANAKELVEAIRATAEGETRVDSAISHKLLEEFRRLSKRMPSGQEGYEHLTNREQDILSLLAKGADNHDIAKQLSLSEKTVRNRLSVIFDKLHVNNRTQAALYAQSQGLTPSKNEQ